MTALTFGNSATYDMYGNLIPTGAGPVLSFGQAAPSGVSSDPFGWSTGTLTGYSLGTTATPTSDAALALSGPLAGSPASATPSASVLAAQAAAAAAANNQSSGYGASGFIYSLGALAKAALAPAAANTPGTIPAAYAPGSTAMPQSGMSPILEIGLIAIAGLVLFELIKKHK